jgi:hypothetical protein
MDAIKPLAEIAVAFGGSIVNHAGGWRLGAGAKKK